MNMIGDDNEDEFVQNFKELRAKFEHHINASKSSPGELGNTIKLKREFSTKKFNSIYLFQDPLNIRIIMS